MPPVPTALPSSLDPLAIFEVTPAALLLLDPALTIVDASDQYLEMTGLRRQDLQGRAVFEAFPESHGKTPDDLLAALARVVRTHATQSVVIRPYGGPAATGGQQASWNTVTTPLLDAGGRLACLLHCIRDSRQPAAPARDPNGGISGDPSADDDLLAGLPHASVFKAVASRMLALVQRREELLAVLSIRLDGLEPVHDTHGREVGDQVFAMAAWRLANSLRKADAVGHLDGHHFAACLTGLHQRENVVAPVTKLLDALSQPYPWGEQTITLTPVIGVSFFPDHGASLEELLLRAREVLGPAESQGTETAEGRRAFHCCPPVPGAASRTLSRIS